MMLKERKVPPQPNWPFELNRNFPSLGELNVKIATEATVLKPSPRGDQKLKMLVNSFDAAVRNWNVPHLHDGMEQTDLHLGRQCHNSH